MGSGVVVSGFRTQRGFSVGELRGLALASENRESHPWGPNAFADIPIGENIRDVFANRSSEAPQELGPGTDPLDLPRYRPLVKVNGVF